MKLRYLLILGLLVFLNGFVFTVLFLMVSREAARPAPTPTETLTESPTMRPTFTPTPIPPTPTNTPQPTATGRPEPTPTNTLVVAPVTPTHTNTPAPATHTAAPPTATFTAEPAAETATPTPTASVSEPTSTSTPTMTPTAEGDWDFRYVQGSVIAQPNCGTVYLKGKITGVGGEPVNGRTVRLRWADNVAYRISGEGENAGEWGFAPLAPEHYHSPFTFLVDIVDSEANPVAQSDTAQIQFTHCDVAGQFTDITFAYAR